QPGPRRLRRLAAAQPAGLELSPRRAERRAGCSAGRAPRGDPRAACPRRGRLHAAAGAPRARDAAGDRVLGVPHELVRLRRPAGAVARPRRRDPRARGARRAVARLLPAHPPATSLPRTVRLPSRKFPGQRGDGAPLPRPAVLRCDDRRTDRHRLWRSRRGAGRGGNLTEGDRMIPRLTRVRELHPMLIRHRTPITVLGNLTIAAGCYLIAFGLRFDFRIPPETFRVVLVTLPLLLLCKLVAFRAANLFSG